MQTIAARMDGEMVAREARAYMVWLEELERSVRPDQGLVSRRYSSPFVTAYSRYSRIKPVVHGAPSICIADIVVERPGHGFFGKFLDQFVAEDCLLRARGLFVENVANPRFVAWLERRGFLRSPCSNPSLPTLFLLCERDASAN